MTAPPKWVAEKLYSIDDRARLAWIDVSEKPRSTMIKYLRILDDKEEVEYDEERNDKTGHFALVKLVPKKKFDDDWWAGEGRIFDKHGATKTDWGNQMTPFRVANIHARDVHSGRVCWYLERWNIPIKLRMLEDLDRREKETTGFRKDMAGAMAEEWRYETNKSDYRSTILPSNPNEAEFKYEQAVAHGDVDLSHESIISHEKHSIKELKDDYKKR